MDLTPLLGQVLDGKYRLEALLGQGGMGAVFRATHLGTDRVVALKVVASGLMDQEAFLVRFQREARAMGRLRHPNIVDLTDFGFAQMANGPQAYLVMEHLDGESLGRMLERNPCPPLGFVVEVVQQVCSALQEAHDHGIIHRDLKPDNLWLEPDRRGGQRVKILDFGLAKLYDPKARREGKPGLPVAEDETQALSILGTEALTPPPVASGKGPLDTQLGTVLGTPAYMSPEQCRGIPLDPRTDLYSLGVILYQMLSGRPPFTGPSLDLINSHIQREPTSLQELRRDLPPGLAELVMECLAKDPARRPASAELLGNAFEACARTFLRQMQQTVAILAERWSDLWPLVRVPALGPFLVLAACGVGGGLAEGGMTSAERLAWFGPGFLLAFGWFFYLQGVLKGMLAPVVLVHTLAPLQPLGGAWSRAFDLRAREMRRMVRLQMLLGFGGAYLLIPMFRLLRHLPPGGLSPLGKLLAAGLVAAFTAIMATLSLQSSRRTGGSLSGAAPCAMLAEGLAYRETAARMDALRAKVRARNIRASLLLDESYLALAFLLFWTALFVVGGALLGQGHGMAGRPVAYHALMACGLYPLVLGLALLDAISTNLTYFRLRQIARESLREAFRDLRAQMERLP